ncbi:hypothetical protein Nocox_19390 [Nonomuraea coxensis DSM 45129]|uniref:Uncharacterized protein n=1 Tax=Nonomuraea coxensis DSM 45129 TaxID=1122611 RepID=A0ABX8U4B3_9ACTN|nr:hypothetical protein [Nonomuraea coxensis]QYC41487.1 hypothetical protein Nocox_19390 [Nonomuraea coxensis DSM 45129]
MGTGTEDHAGGPSSRAARRERALRLVEEGRRDEALPLWRAELDTGESGLAWMQDQLHALLERRDLTAAGECAAIAAELRWGAGSGPVPRASVPMSVPKLRHDLQQLGHLRGQGVLGEEHAPVIDAYRRAHDRLAARGADAREPLDAAADPVLAGAYNRLLHVRDTPRVARALSSRWDPAAVEEQYLANPPGVVFVDGFLTEEALDGLYRFCLDSTIWSGNRYAHGRLGAFFQDGFACPLLMQIAEELREALPRLIGERYPLRQMWGFKSGPELPADATTHADFAAVNVNFWITPDSANLDPGSGGLVVHDLDAPLSWDFDTYNGRSDLIRPFLRERRARSMTIPYRRNRAVVFNSDLFHATDAVRFRPGYENLRVNVTMLYGDREAEVHHRELSGPVTTLSRPAWRSAAFARRKAGARPRKG